ncbi:MotA/TolQ/ExbB proton channel family protein [Endozoicomonas ascidiicola]|uniref:MotA/TolQ/ExbB proton channel family protein n=1 Tax=Endozoicomonas ascidiicola TaxID=1698521 RepID=UPI000836CD47|nr:MotA/TolQ/ExbB proton channel family protein [Endozoicomonas ascidiicola]
MSPGNFIEGLFYKASSELWTDIFIWLILGVFILAVFEASRGKHSRFLEHAPNVMTSLGILGTFTGIIIGLLHFQPDKIDESISLLLDGLKTAFITSLVGMFASILFKGLDAWKFAPMREDGDEKEDVTPKDIYQQLSGQTELLTQLRESLAGNEDGSVNGQLKNLRNDLRDAAKKRDKDHQDFALKLWSQMENFADMLSKSATEKVIEALKQVIVEFNQNLTEQFGENFKALDASVKKLVDWQQQYMEQLTQMSQQYAEGVKAINNTRDAVSTISEKTGEIPESMDQLKAVLEVNQHQIAELQRHLKAFVNMRDQAVKAVPEIQAQVKGVGDQLQQGAQEMKKVMLEGATQFSDSVNQTNASITSMAGSLTSNANSITATLKDGSEKVHNTTRDMVERLEHSSKNLQGELERSISTVLTTIQDQSKKSLGAVESQIRDAVSRSGEGVNRQLAALDQSLQQELNRVMQELGLALTSITKKMAEDYHRMVATQNPSNNNHRG